MGCPLLLSSLPGQRRRERKYGILKFKKRPERCLGILLSLMRDDTKRLGQLSTVDNRRLGVECDIEDAGELGLTRIAPGVVGATLHHSIPLSD